MNLIWMKRCLEAGVIVGGMWLLGTGLASAQGVSPHPAPGLLNAPITAPITVCGNAVGLLGTGSAHCATSGPTGSGSTAHRSLISVPVTAPITVCGNAVGRAAAGCTVAKSAGSSSTGTVASVPVTAPITVCGNGAGLLGRASASCAGQTGTGSGGSTSGSTGISVPVSAPVTACGNTVGVLGSATASCGSTLPVTGGSPPGTGGSSITATSGHAVDAGSIERARDKSALKLAGRSGALAFTGSSLIMLEWLAVSLLLVGCVLSIGWRRHSR